MSEREHEFNEEVSIALADHVEPAIRRLAAAITPNLCGSPDASGAHVESLTEAVMGLTKAMTMIAEAIHEVAEAIDNKGDVAVALDELTITGSSGRKYLQVSGEIETFAAE